MERILAVSPLWNQRISNSIDDLDRNTHASKRSPFKELRSLLIHHLTVENCQQIKIFFEEAQRIVNHYNVSPHENHMMRHNVVLLQVARDSADYYKIGHIYELFLPLQLQISNEDLMYVCEDILKCMKHRHFTYFRNSPTNTTIQLLRFCDELYSLLATAVYPSIHGMTMSWVLSYSNVDLFQPLELNALLSLPAPGLCRINDKFSEYCKYKMFTSIIDLEQIDVNVTPILIEIAQAGNMYFYTREELQTYITTMQSDKSPATKNTLTLFKPGDPLEPGKLLTPEQLLPYLLEGSIFFKVVNESQLS